jgi:tRNA-splicing ligase RtcB
MVVGGKRALCVYRAEEAPGACKNVDLLTEAAAEPGFARRVAFLRPRVCGKG